MCKRGGDEQPRHADDGVDKVPAAGSAPYHPPLPHTPPDLRSAASFLVGPRLPRHHHTTRPRSDATPGRPAPRQAGQGAVRVYCGAPRPPLHHPSRPEHFSGQVRAVLKNNLLFRAERILPMTIPLDASGLNFRAGPELGRVSHVFYSVKQLKTAFRAELEPKFFFRGLQNLRPRPSSKVRGRAWRGPSWTGLKILRYTSETSARPRRRAGTPPGRCGAGGSCASAEGLCPGRRGGEGPPCASSLEGPALVVESGRRRWQPRVDGRFRTRPPPSASLSPPQMEVARVFFLI
jgi:hypothetical protein